MNRDMKLMIYKAWSFNAANQKYPFINNTGPVPGFYNVSLFY